MVLLRIAVELGVEMESFNGLEIIIVIENN